MPLQRGHPTKKRMRKGHWKAKAEKKKKRCSRCGKTTHNRRTCRATKGPFKRKHINDDEASLIRTREEEEGEGDDESFTADESSTVEHSSHFEINDAAEELADFSDDEWVDQLSAELDGEENGSTESIDIVEKENRKELETQEQFRKRRAAERLAKRREWDAEDQELEDKLTERMTRELHNGQTEMWYLEPDAAKLHPAGRVWLRKQTLLQNSLKPVSEGPHNSSESVENAGNIHKHILLEEVEKELSIAGNTRRSKRQKRLTQKAAEMVEH